MSFNESEVRSFLECADAENRRRLDELFDKSICRKKSILYSNVAVVMFCPGYEQHREDFRSVARTYSDTLSVGVWSNCCLVLGTRVRYLHIVGDLKDCFRDWVRESFACRMAPKSQALEVFRAAWKVHA